MDIETTVRERYSEAAQTYQAGLCCPRTYDPQYLTVIPAEVLERDYGCGDPSPYVRVGETVLDLGSGGGKICFITAQMVGAQGQVIGVDMNAEMLALARQAQPLVAERLGYNNVVFRKGRIEDLGLDCESLDAYLRDHPITSEYELKQLDGLLTSWRLERPLISDSSIDVVLSNCVLNLVSQEKKRQVFSELFRVLKPGGRAVISDIVSDEDVPATLQANPELWSGCYSGALREDRFLAAFADAGLHGVTLVKQDVDAWHAIGGIAFRSVTVIAYKSRNEPLSGSSQEIVFRGPFLRVEIDDGTVMERGRRTRVSERAFQLLSQDPYRDFIFQLQPSEAEATHVKQARSPLPLPMASCGPDCGCS